MCGGVGMLGLADLLAGDAFAAGTHVVGPHFAPKAKHVILLFMTGGPSSDPAWPRAGPTSTDKTGQGRRNTPRRSSLREMGVPSFTEVTRNW